MGSTLEPSMYLAHADLIGVAPFGEMSFPFRGDDSEPRPVTVVQGAGGVGKTALLHALAYTRPGNAMALIGRTPVGATEPARAHCEWVLGDDDPERPHPLLVATPSNRNRSDDELALIQRREQTLFDRRAKEGRGFVFVSLSATRWYSRQAVAIHAPLRTIAHYDVKGTAAFDDAGHSDLTRATKQALAYAAISSALAPSTQRERNRLRESSPRPWDTRVFGTAMHEVVDQLVGLAGFSYEGLDPTSFEPMFRTSGGSLAMFDRLPRRVRDLVAIGALPVRALWAGYPGEDPRASQGVVVIDEVDLQQDDQVRERLLGVLRLSLPRVQWIVTTSSSALAATVDADCLMALRRLPRNDALALYTGNEARVH